MRFGTFIGKCRTPEELAARARLQGYTAVGVDGALTATPQARREYVEVMRRHELQIAEVGAWSNPISPLPEQRREALDHCKRQLALAEEVGARSCVNIAGSRGLKWDGPHPSNLTNETFDMIVQSVREIIDSVKPARTFYSLETMPWIFPDSAESYLALVKAIDRKAFAVHYDPVNMINSPARIFDNASQIREFTAKLGPLIRSVHVKDIRITENLTVHLEECRPGTGALDHATLFRELAKLDPEIPVMMEHLPEEEYPLAAKYLRATAAAVGVKI
jgi:sugar phosphate isomerase/epimerase